MPRWMTFLALLLMTTIMGVPMASAAGEPGSSVEPFRSSPGPGFFGYPITCTSDRSSSCSTRADLSETFLLQYVQLSVRSDPGAGCSGSARIVVFLDTPGTRTIDVLELRAAEDATDATTVVLPSPVRLQPGEQLEVEGSSHAAGGACRVSAAFGGIRGSRINVGAPVPLPPGL